MKKTLVTYLLILQAGLICAQQLDASFHSPIPLRRSEIWAMKLQPDGKMLYGGEISFHETESVDNLVRLLPDGTRDNTFNFSGETEYIVDFIELQSNGNIIVSDGNTIRILSSTGSLLNTLGVPENFSHISAIAVQNDNKILVAFIAFEGTSILKKYSEAGAEDLTFKQDVVTDKAINHIGFQNNNIIIGGYFATVSGVTKNDFARLDADGNLDETFDTGSGTTDGINGFAVQADGKILPSNTYINNFNGHQFHGMVRLNMDGSVDSGFELPIWLHGSTSTIKLNDTKILFAAYYNGVVQLFQLNSDGSFDPSFTEIPLTTHSPVFELTPEGIIISNNAGSGNPLGIARYSFSGDKLDGYAPELFRYGIINQVDFTQDNNIIVGGDFIKIDGVATAYVARLFANGEVDPSFVVSEDQESVFQLQVLEDNSILVSAANDMFKLDANGELMNDFNFEYFKELYQITKFHVQPDQHIIAVGPNNIYRLMPDGSEDITFDIGTGSGGSNGTLHDMDVQSTGKIVYGGLFDSFNGTLVNRLVRLNTDASVDDTFNFGTGPNEDVATVAVVNNDEIIVAGNFTSFNGIAVNRFIKLTADGMPDENFTSNLPADLPWSINIAKPFWNKIIISNGYSYFRVIENDGKPYDDFQLPPEILEFNRIDNIIPRETNMVFVTGKIRVLDQQQPVFMVKLLHEPRPVITGVTVPHATEDTPLEIDISQVTATDAWQVFPGGFSFSLLPGEHYLIDGSSIVPENDYNGQLTVGLTVSNANTESLPFSFIINVDAVNDAPVILSVKDNLETITGTALAFELNDITVSDPDNVFPEEFAFSFLPGEGYTIVDNQLIPDEDTEGTITAGIVVNDGEVDSEPFTFNVAVNLVTSTESAVLSDGLPYPNPATDQFAIAMTQSRATVQLRNITGSVVLQADITRERNGLDIRHLPQGVYLLEVRDENGSVSKSRLMKH